MSVVTEITRLQNAKAALKESIEAKGVTVEDSAKLDEYPALVDSIPQGGGGGVEEKDVNFYDYDGTCVYSYTKNEFLALNEMPANPDHSDEGLISEGWVYDLQKSKNYASIIGYLDLAQKYSSLNDWTKIFITIPTGLIFYLTFIAANNDSGIVDWGDNSTTNIVSQSHTYSHEYISGGSYIITIKNNYSITFRVSSGRTIFGGEYEYLYLNSYVTKIIFGNCICENNSLNNFYEKKTQLIFTNYKNIPNTSIFYTTMDVKPYTVVTNTLNKHFKYIKCKVLIFEINNGDNFNIYDISYVLNVKNIIIPNNAIILQDDFFRFSNLLKTIFLPDSITSIGNNFCGNCTNLYKVIISNPVPPTLGSSAFGEAKYNNHLTIYVPAESVEAYKAATNWSALADKIFAIPTE